MKTLEEWLSYLESLHPEEIELGLGRVIQVASQLSLSKPAPIHMTVAGTNGKGSFCHFTEQALLSLGKTVGCYTSPHLIDYNERIRINGEVASDQRLIEAFTAIESARGDTQLTYFEFGTLAAYWLFQRSDLDVVITEVGLGGRLDAVNWLPADIAVITNVAMDHEGWLGNTLEDIGREKAGIVHSGQKVYYGDATPLESVIARVTETNASLVMLGRDVDCSVLGENWSWSKGDKAFQLPLPKLPHTSVALSLSVLDELGSLPDEDVLQQWMGFSLSGRGQILQRDGVAFLLDVAHNPAAKDRLLNSLPPLKQGQKRFALFAAMKDKDLTAMLARTESVFDGWFVADLPKMPRGATGNELSEIIPHKVISVSKSPRQALARVKMIANPGDQVVVWGSFFVVGPVLEQLTKTRKKNKEG